MDGGRAVLAARAADAEPAPTGLARLAEAAGYDPVASVAQQRREDPGAWMGRGKAEAVAERAAETAADAVLVDGGLTPGQYANLLELLPPGTELVDRYRLGLGIFADGSADRRAALQVEAATLRYELPRLRQATEESLLNGATEKGSPVLDTERRIDRIESKLSALASEAGLGLVALAGYTNAGKTTLFHRLADGLSVETGPGHDDETDSKPVGDALFVTLETTTRRGEVDGRPAIFTDTGGCWTACYMPSTSRSEPLSRPSKGRTSRCPSWTRATRSSGSAGRSRCRWTRSTPRPVVALDKIDVLGEGELAPRRAVVADLLGGEDGDGDGGTVVPVSARDGTGIERLRAAVADRLPTERARVDPPSAPGTESFLAWARERGACEVTYGGERVAVEFVSRPETVAEARGRAPTEGLRAGPA
jgi:GTP-binding protein HflX